MFTFVPHSVVASSRRNQHHHRQHRASALAFSPQPQPVFFDPFSLSQHHQQQALSFSSGEDTDEEELLLRAALERKRRERLARQQYRQQQQQQLQLQQQKLLEQQRYEALLRQERARQLAIAQAQAQAQAAQYRADQEATAVFQAIFVQQQQQQQQREHQARAHAIKESKRQEQKRQLRAALEKEAQQEESDEEDANQLDPLSNLLEALFFPQQKRVQPQEENYPCKRRQQQCIAVQQQQQQQQQQAKQETQRKERDQTETKRADLETQKSKEQQEQQQQQQQQKQKPATTPQADFLEALPSILSFVEAVFGGAANESSPSQGSASACAASNKAQPSGCSFNKAAATAPVPAASSAGASPELKAADILRERQQRLHKQSMTLQQKHSELNLIESALDSFALDLREAMDGLESEESKRVVLSAEENVSKAMFRIDSVESEGDLSVRQRRKELIKKSQEMLDKVDELKTQKTNTGKKVVRSVSVEDVPESSASNGGDDNDVVVVLDAETAVDTELEPADVDQPLPTESEPVTGDENRDQSQPKAYSNSSSEEDEVIEPYTVSTSAAPSPADSDTVQDDGEPLRTEHNIPTSAENQTQEERKSADGRTLPAAAAAAAAAAEPAHDDYEIVPEF